MKYANLISWGLVTSFAIFTYVVFFEPELGFVGTAELNSVAALLLLIFNAWAFVILRKIGKQQK